MKLSFIFILIFAFKFSYSQEQDSLSATTKLVLSGIYQGNSLYVLNPYRESGIGFCIERVTVNGWEMCEHKGSAYEIGFWCYKNLAIGDSVTIVIEHYADCLPRVLNQTNVYPKPTFVLLDFNLDTTGQLTWTTVQEEGRLMYTIEQFRWNKWVKVCEVEGIGMVDTNAYSVNVKKWFHSGENMFRLKQVGFGNAPRMSPRIKITPGIPTVSFGPKKMLSFITFSDSTHYEVYDAYGNIVSKGYDIRYDVRTLDSGAYYINFDNRNEKFIRP